MIEKVKRDSWPQFAMRLAQAAVDGRCEAPYTRVGACCLRADHSVAGIGYAGPPPGIEIDWTNRDQRCKRVIHAEINTLKFIRPGEGQLLAVTTIPCLSCLSAIASWGIKEVYYRDDWNKADPETHTIAEHFKIKLVQLATPVVSTEKSFEKME